MSLCLVFFFQAEDGIRDDLVTGVQTCALPISPPCRVGAAAADFGAGLAFLSLAGVGGQAHARGPRGPCLGREIGRASCRERGEISVVAVSLKKKKSNKTGDEWVGRLKGASGAG